MLGNILKIIYLKAGNRSRLELALGLKQKPVERADPKQQFKFLFSIK